MRPALSRAVLERLSAQAIREEQTLETEGAEVLGQNAGEQLPQRAVWERMGPRMPPLRPQEGYRCR